MKVQRKIHMHILSKAVNFWEVELVLKLLKVKYLTFVVLLETLSCNSSFWACTKLFFSTVLGKNVSVPFLSVLKTILKVWEFDVFPL